MTSSPQQPPILRDKDFDAPSAFTPESLLREARRQKGADAAAVPAICLLDPDGDIVRQLRAAGRGRRHDAWVCYHTEMWLLELDGREVGVVGCAVGASFAVFVAEEMFAAGCALLVSVTSSGQIAPQTAGQGAPPYFILIERALRDEGVRYRYLPSADWSAAPAPLLARLDGAFDIGPRVLTGATWTTDAPFRETEGAIAAARARGVLAVEMEAAGLYAFAEARGRAVVCLADVINRMGAIEGDSEKGDANGATDAFAVAARIVARLAELYWRNATALQDLPADKATRREAMELIRNLVDRIEVRPGDEEGADARRTCRRPHRTAWFRLRRPQNRSVRRLRWGLGGCGGMQPTLFARKKDTKSSCLIAA